MGRACQCCIIINTALHANRLFLLAGIQCVLKHVLIPQWEQHAKLLESNIDYDEILNREFLNKISHYVGELPDAVFYCQS